MANKHLEYMDWSYSDTEANTSINHGWAANLSYDKFKETETAKTMFPQYGEAAREIRLKAIHAAAVDKAKKEGLIATDKKSDDKVGDGKAKDDHK